MTQPRTNGTESHATCNYCGTTYYSHGKRCPDAKWDKREVRRCLLERDHNGEHVYREYQQGRVQ